MLYQRGHGNDVHVAAGKDGHHVQALALDALEGSHGEQSGVFHHHLVLFHDIQEGVHQLGVGNGDDVVHIVLYIGEDQIARGLHRHAVGNGVGGGQGDHVARLQAGLHRGRAFRLHTDDGDVGV